ncbi:MAG: hypothetical protein H6839_01855 [Planctomycetes bacterium]|nr:hypothetical protein [Planctomycetota bacterium]
MDGLRGNIPYHYGDLQSHLKPVSSARPASPEKTTGMIAVPVALIVFCVLLPVLLCGIRWLEHERYEPGVWFSYIYSLPFAVLPIISIRNFVKQQRAKCR